MKTRSLWCAAAVAALSLAALAACDQKLASQPTRDTREVDASFTAPTGLAATAAASVTRPAEPVRLVAGKPMWSDNRRHTAQENAEYQFQQHGTELGAANLDDFVAKAHRFVGSSPSGVLKLTRANGDTLMFDPGSKLFAVVRSDGAPRTVFKPETGRAYWDQQVAAEKDGGTTTTRRTASRTRTSDDRS